MSADASSKERSDSLVQALAIGAGAALGVGAFLAIRKAMGPRVPPGVRLLDGMAHAPFPGQGVPDAAVIIPPNFRPWPTLRVCVYIRGFGNCSANVVGDQDTRCRAIGKVRAASHLASQLARSGANVLVVVPELRHDAASSEPGNLEAPGGLAAFLDEALARVAPEIGSYSSSSIDHLSVMCHSGGYLACAAVMESGHPALRSVVLLDSLYAADHRFAAWIRSHAAEFTPDGGYRFADVYTAGGGTADRSYALAGVAEDALTRAGTVGNMLYDATAATLADADYLQHVLFKFSGLNHTDVTRYYPERFWAAGW